MSELASRSQLRMSLLRWVMVTIPGVVLLGFLSASLSPSGDDSTWFRALAKPDLNPPGWVFPVVWTTLYAMMGLALAMILNARRARGRGFAVLLFVAQLGVNLAWSPVFFGMHKVGLALILIVVILILAIATTFAFARVRRTAAWLMLPYLVWLGFAGVLNWRFDQLNPQAETLAPASATTQIAL